MLPSPPSLQSDGILKPLPPIPKGFEWVTEPVKQDELARNLKVISDVLERNRGHISADHSRTQLTKVMIRNIAYFNCNEWDRTCRPCMYALLAEEELSPNCSHSSNTAV